MSVIGAGLIGAAGDLAGSAYAAHHNAKQSSKQMAFQERMANTQYQRAADDLEKAGLNRVLALGSPAAAPSGATSAINAPKLGSTGIAAASAKQSIEQSKALTRVHDNQADLIAEQKRLAKANADKAEFTTSPYEALGPAAGDLSNWLRNTLSNAVDAKDKIPDKIDNLIDGATDIKNKYLPKGKKFIKDAYNFEWLKNAWRKTNNDH